MRVPVFKQKEFIEFLKNNGFKIVSNKFWDKSDRIILEKDGNTFPLQMKEKYFYPIVCKICQSLMIEPPEDHKKVYEQHMNMINKRK